MAFINEDIHDAGLGEFSVGNQMTVCHTQPTNRTEAVTTYALASVGLVAGDFTIANGDVSGRKVTVSEKLEVTVDATETARFIAIVDGTRLLAVTDVENVQGVTAGNTINITAWPYEIRDPS